MFEVSTLATSKDEYLLRPDLGRNFSNDTAAQIQQECPAKADLQVIIGDGLSVTAVASQVPGPAAVDRQACQRAPMDPGTSLRRPLLSRRHHEPVGELLNPKVVLLLIGERPGLATAESLSAYMAFNPRNGDNDAHRNLISNIHARGVSADAAAIRIINLAQSMMVAAAKRRAGEGNSETAQMVEQRT